MDEKARNIIETLAHVKDATAVLQHITLTADEPKQAGAIAEIIAADASLKNGIAKLEELKTEAINNSKN